MFQNYDTYVITCASLYCFCNWNMNATNLNLQVLGNTECDGTMVSGENDMTHEEEKVSLKQYVHCS